MASWALRGGSGFAPMEGASLSFQVQWLEWHMVLDAHSSVRAIPGESEDHLKVELQGVWCMAMSVITSKRSQLLR